MVHTYFPNPAPAGHYTIEQTISRVVEYRGLEIIEADAIVQRAILDRNLPLLAENAAGKLVQVPVMPLANAEVWVPAARDTTAVPGRCVHVLPIDRVETWLTTPGREWAKVAQAVAYNRFFALMMGGPSEKPAGDYIEATVHGDDAIPDLSGHAARDAWAEARRNTSDSAYAESWSRRGPKTGD